MRSSWREIAREYGYTDFAAAEHELIRWVDDQAWTSGDGPALEELLDVRRRLR